MNGDVTSDQPTLSLAQGDYIKLLPADDTLSPECIAPQAVQFNEYGGATSLRAALNTFRIDQNLSVRIGWDRCAQFLSFSPDIS